MRLAVRALELPQSEKRARGCPPEDMRLLLGIVRLQCPAQGPRNDCPRERRCIDAKAGGDRRRTP